MNVACDCGGRRLLELNGPDAARVMELEDGARHECHGTCEEEHVVVDVAFGGFVSFEKEAARSMYEHRAARRVEHIKAYHYQH